MVSRELIWLAICIYHEARNQPEEGRIAVGHVILNRVSKRGLSVKEVVLQPMQFSWANGGARPPIKEYEALEESCVSAEKCLNERLEGKDLWGSNLYYADYIEEPYWAKKAKFIKKIGNHIFFRE